MEGVNENRFSLPITKEEIFKEVKVINNTPSWPEVTQKIIFSNGMEFDAPYEVDPIVLSPLRKVFSKNRNPRPPISIGPRGSNRIVNIVFSQKNR